MKSKVLTKFLSAAFSAVLAVSTFAPLSLVAGAESAAWDGTQSAPTVGEGTAESPLEIGKAAELAWLVNQSEEDTTGKYYKLTADIALNDTSSANWQASAKAWYVQNDAADAATFFAGHFDGDGHTVSGLYFGDRLNAAQSELAFWSLDAGLFPTLAAGATIENLGIINSQITANDICSGKGEVYAGLIAGKGYATTDNPITIKNCFADDTNTVVSKNAVGGLIGFSNGALVAENCYSSANLQSKFVSENGNIQIGGIVGQVDKEFTAVNCFSIGYRIAKEYWVGTTFNYTNCYTTAMPVKDENPSGVTQLSTAEMTGKSAIKRMGLPSAVWTAIDGALPYLKNSSYVPTAKSWDEVQQVPVNGNGSESHPYKITNAYELAWVVTQTAEATSGKYYKLTKDIVLNNTSADNWQASAKAWYVQNDAANAATFFAGHFDGNGHTVSGLYFGDSLNAAQSGLDFWSLAAGLFPTLAAGATIENLGIINSQITAVDICNNKGEVYAGLIAGKGYATTDNPITIKNCFADDTNTVVSKNAVGGLIGFSNGALVAENCYSSAKLESKFVSENGNIQIGGIVGQVDKEFTAENCYSVHARLAKEYWVNTTFNYTNCYTTAIPVKDENPAGVTQPDDVNKMFGEGAVAYMGFDSSVWVDTDKSPALRIFTEPSIVIGDLNDDSVINAEDITLMRKALLLGYTDEVYDVNGDSDVNILDLISLKKLAD